MQSAAKPRGLHHVAILTRDWDGANRFYQDILGFTVKVGWETPAGRAAYLDAGDGSCMEVFELRDGVKLPNGVPQPEGPILHLCLRTDELDEAYRRAIASGAKSIVEPQDTVIEPTTGGEPVPVRLCFFEGPTGEWIELLEGAP